MPPHSDENESVQRRLRRIEGQVRGIQRMVGEDRACVHVLEQVSAATRALESVALELLDRHVAQCVADAVRPDAVRPDAKDSSAKLGEVPTAIARQVRS